MYNCKTPRPPTDQMRSESPATSIPSLRRIPSLDGLRAVSIVMVLGLHTLQRHSLHHPVSLLWYALLNGSLGVYIFFVISGYLITKLLLREHDLNGRISLSLFYLKRCFRILPPLYIYVGVLALLALAGRVALSRIDVVSALFFFHNYALASTSWAIEHFWSLSVEEQFYLVWPLVLIACLHLALKQGRVRAAAAAGIVIVLSPAIRIVSFRLHQPLLHDGAGFHMHADALMMGCAAGLLEGRARFEQVYRFVTRIWWLPIVALAVGSYLEIRFGNYWSFPLGETYTGFFIVAFLLWCIRNPDTPLGRLLNSRPVIHIGVLSYSMYIWQTLFLHHDNVTVFERAEWLGQFPVNWLAIVLVAEVSHRLVELPSNLLRNRLLRHLAEASARKQTAMNSAGQPSFPETSQR